jgi:hypothetical protein
MRFSNNSVSALARRVAMQTKQTRGRMLVAAGLTTLFVIVRLPDTKAQIDFDREDGRSPREAAPIDLTGVWVSVVSEDWRFRMSLAQKGDWDIIPLNPAGREAAENADVTRDECMAYGAAGILRIPGRLRISWEDDSTLRIDTDAGMQTRRLYFGDTEPSLSTPSRQGHSSAVWQSSIPVADAGAHVSPGGELEVVTRGFSPGYYFKHGVPYSGDAVMTEYFARVSEDNGDEYLFVTAIVEDPVYLRTQFVRTLTFRQEQDDSNWNPMPCSVP